MVRYRSSTARNRSRRPARNRSSTVRDRSRWMDRYRRNTARQERDDVYRQKLSG